MVDDEEMIKEFVLVGGVGEEEVFEVLEFDGFVGVVDYGVDVFVENWDFDGGFDDFVSFGNFYVEFDLEWGFEGFEEVVC